MNKPNKVPTWAHGPDAGIVEPSLGKRLVGWIIERPNHEYFNWLFNLIGQWLEFVDTQFASDGAKRIQTVANIAALKALTPEHDDIVRFNGALFAFDSTDTTAGDDVLVIEPASGVGRWHHVAHAAAGVPNGLARLDGNGDVMQDPASKGKANGVLGLDGNKRIALWPDDIALPAGYENQTPPTARVTGSKNTDSGGGSTAVLAKGGAAGSGDGGIGIDASGGTSTTGSHGVAGRFAANAHRGAINLVPLADDPAKNNAGDVYYKTGANQGLRVNHGSGWATVVLLMPNGGIARAVEAGAAIEGVSNGAGPAIKGDSSSGSGVGGEFKANSSRGAINIAYSGTLGGGVEGDLVVHGGALKVYLNDAGSGAPGWKTI